MPSTSYSFGETSYESYIPSDISYRFVNESECASSKISKTVPLYSDNLDGNILIASAWVKLAGASSNARVKLSVDLEYCSSPKQTKYAEFDPTYSGWQYVAVPVKYNYSPEAIEATVSVGFNNTEGECYITNVRLVTAEATFIKNEYGRCIATPEVFECVQVINRRITKTDINYISEDYINEAGDTVVSLIRKNGSGHSFRTDIEYDSAHNLTRIKDWRGIITENEYNKYGKLTKRKVYSECDSSQYKISEYKYYNNGLLLSESDPLNEYVKQYTYDMDNGLLKSTIDFNGQIYTNAYDSNTDEMIGLSSNDGETCLYNGFDYTLGYLTNLTHNGFSYGFDFDALGRQTAVRIAGKTLFSKEYTEDDISQTEKTVYENGEETVIVSDGRGNPVSRTYKANADAQVRELFSVEYNSAGAIKKYIDNESGICYNYKYNSHGQVVEVTESDLSGNILRVNTYTYDTKHRLVSTTYGETKHTYKPIYEKDCRDIDYPDDVILGIELSGVFCDQICKDSLGRIERDTITVANNSAPLINTHYIYDSRNVSDGCVQSSRVKNIQHSVNGTTTDTEYWYDKNGNVIGIFENAGLTCIYTYDKWNRIVREVNYKLGTTYTWDYDQGGNILSKKAYNVYDSDMSHCENLNTYMYEDEGNRDRLLCFNGQPISYDSLGNPTYYKGNSLKWTKCRKLARYGDNTFEYNAHGIRVKKNNTVYVLKGDKILSETDGCNILTYYYGMKGVIGFNYNGDDYYYRKNLFGDITDIYTESGTKVASYIYDAWGNHQITTNVNDIANINPIRYRGYYYDVETNLYYLQTRYYDPETGRFINADAIEYLMPKQVMGLNLYAYCGNNPVMLTDPHGNSAKGWFIAAVTAISAAVGLISGALCAAIEYAAFVEEDEFSWRGLGASAAGGAVNGTITGAFSGFLGVKSTSYAGLILGGGFGGLVGGISGSLVENAINGTLDEDGKAFDIFMDGFWGAMGGILGGLTQTPIVGSSAGAAAMKYLKHPIKNAVSDFVENILSSYTEWLIESTTEGVIEKCRKGD